MELVTFLLLCLAIILSYLKLFSKSPERKRIEYLIDQLPGPPKLPIIGTAKEFIGATREDFLGILIRRNYKYGPIFRSWSGSIPVCHIMKAEHVESILSNTVNLRKGESYKFMRVWLKEGLITSEGEKWFRHRKLLTPTFHFKILDNFHEVMAEKAELLVKKLESKADGSFFDIYPYITYCTLDTISKTAMGIETNAMSGTRSEYVKAIYGVMEAIIHRVYRPNLHPDLIFKLTEKGRLQEKYLSYLYNFTQKIIQERRKRMQDEDINTTTKEDELLGKKRRLAFLDLLLETNKVNSKLTDDEIAEEVDTFMFAGHDTTTVTICWVLFALGNHQDIQRKVQEELDAILHEDEPITPQHLTEMQYMERVLKETMRMYPTVPIIARTLTSDLQIDKYTIPASTMVTIHICNLHKDPDQFPEPERFDPDRFLPERSAKRHPYAFVPFSAGPRNCLGQKFAMRSMKNLLASILRKFNVKARDKPEEIKCFGEMVLRSQNGIVLSFTPRKKLID